jgi:tetratricopeptide (TPR) repeat protein
MTTNGQFFGGAHMALLAAALFALPAAPQTSPGTSAQNPDALTEYNQAMQARDWPHAVSAAGQLVSLHTNSQNLKLLANAQLYSGLASDALGTYDRALAAAQQEKPAAGQAGDHASDQATGTWKSGLADIYIGKGNALLKLKRTSEAIEAYNQGAEFALNQGRAYFNICATLYNIGDTHGAPAACRKCLEADPSKADAWFILGSVLFADSPTDSNGKVVASPETRQALEKYLTLAPDGPHAADVKAMLEMTAK